MKRLSLILLFSSQAIAQVKYVEKGTPAPYDGYLFTPEKEQEVRQANESLKYYKLVDETSQRILTLKDNEIKLLTESSTIWHNQSIELSKQLEASKDSSFWRQALYFGLGAVLTTAITFGVNQASK